MASNSLFFQFNQLQNTTDKEDKPKKYLPANRINNYDNLRPLLGASWQWRGGTSVIRQNRFNGHRRIWHNGRRRSRPQEIQSCKITVIRLTSAHKNAG
jgi:hypothetical protein